MNKLFPAIMMICISMIWTSCSKKTESPIPLPPVKKIIVDFEGTIYLYQDTFQFASVVGTESAILKMNTTVENGVWEVSHPSCKKCKKDLEVVLVTPYLEQIELKSKALVIAEESITQSDLSIINRGSGKIDFKSLQVDSLNVELASVGEIRLHGSGDRVIAKNSGSNNIQMDSYVGRVVDATTQDVGSIYTVVTDTLNATIQNSGNVYYKGQPAVFEQVTGTGRVLDNN